MGAEMGVSELRWRSKGSFRGFFAKIGRSASVPFTVIASLAR